LPGEREEDPMTNAFQRYYGTPVRAKVAARRKPKKPAKPKDARVSGGGHRRRTVNAPKAW
jgi:hypothetical protein